MNERTKKLTTLAMLAALAYLVMVVIKIPVVLFLKYEPKDIIIAIGGFIYGPFAAFLVSVVVSFVEMITVSAEGIIGFIMNVLSTCAFACTASFIYKKKQSLSGAVIGLLAGCLAATALMLVWNYLITPIYMKKPRSEVAAMLLPAFLPFNLVKGGLNAALTMLLYKPVVMTLRKSHLVAASQSPHQGKVSWGLIAISVLLLATCIFFILTMQGIV